MKVPLLDLKPQYESIRKEVDDAIREVLSKSSFILGPYVEKFEKEITAYTGTKHAIGVASGTDAILISLMALGIKPGDEVITTPYTFFATAGSVSRLGAKPVFVDIDPDTYNINPGQITKEINDNTKAVIPVHLYGQCAEMDEILKIAGENGLKVAEDAAQSIGAEYKERSSGSMGDTGCLSFFPSKNLGCCGDGGMVVTNNEEIAEKIKILRVHGSKPKYYHPVIGLNSRLDSIQAAILSVKLKYLERWAESRRINAIKYNELLKDTPVGTPFVESYNLHVYNQYVIRVNDRDGLQKHLAGKGIETALYYPLPLHLQECYRELGYKEGDFPEAEKAAKETLSIPVFPELKDEQLRHVAESIKEYLI